MPLEPQSILLTGRVAVVTGAAVGLGKAIAETFARFGADLAICDRDAENLARTGHAIESAGRRALAAELDVRDAERVREFFEGIEATFGRVDVLVNNAGGGFHAMFVEVGEKGQDALIRENFSSVTHFVRGAVPLMTGRGGSIVNITSIEAHRAGPGYAVYSAMKAAVANLTKSLALELGERMIRVNCIAPDSSRPPVSAGAARPTPLPRQATSTTSPRPHSPRLGPVVLRHRHDHSRRRRHWAAGLRRGGGWFPAS